LILVPCFKTKSRRLFKIVQLSAKLPDAKIELARFFDRDVNVRYDEKTGALVIESKLTLDPLAEAPSIPG
jgi:hypothetical protein